MKKQIILSILIITIFINGNSQTRMIKSGDTIRQFTIYVSSKIEEGKTAPVLFNFHGYGMTALEHMMYTQTNRLAEEKGLIVIYPQGLNNDWNVGFDQDYDHGSKDVEFIKTLIQKLPKHYPVDTTQIYATGLSRGGFFIQRLVAEMPNSIKAFASVGAPMSIEVKKRMQSDELVKAIYVHGIADEIVDVNGVKEEYFSIDECLNYWKQRNNNSKGMNLKVINPVDDQTSVSIKDYGSVIYVEIENGGHTWPGADPFNVGFPLGETTQDLDFNEFLYNYLMN